MKEVGEILDRLPLTRIERRILDALAQAQGRYVQTETLVDAVYWDCPDGGPVTARNCIDVVVSRVRAKLAGSGLSVQSHTGAGRRLVEGEGLPFRSHPPSRTTRWRHAQTA